jgi:hypothetical protein
MTSPFLYKAGKFFRFTYGCITAGITAASALAAAGLDTENPNEMPRNTEALKSYLRQGYLTLNPQAETNEVEEFVEANTVEYRANGGRIGFAEGMLSFEEAKAMNPGMFSAEVETDVVRPNTELLNYIKRIRDAVEKGIIPMDFAMDLIKQKTMEQGVDLQDLRDDIMETQRIEQAYGGRIGYNEGTDFQKWLEGKQKFEQGQNAEQLYREYLEDKRRQKVAEQKTMAANGGRIGYAFGNPEQNAINAAGIMNLPLNQNPAGVTELDLRETGGFIPPVGVKEKADDIPAMLSNNEFVFTAKSVKEMGDGDVNKGAQRMYDMMKKLRKRRKSLMAETITQVTQPPEFIESESKLYLDQLRKAIGGLQGADLSQIMGPQFIAGQDPLQLQAQQAALAGIGGYQPYLQSAAASAGPDAYQQHLCLHINKM